MILQYWGTANYNEFPLTGVLRLWTTGQVQDVPDAIATKLLAAGVGFQADSHNYRGEPAIAVSDPSTGEIALSTGGLKSLPQLPTNPRKRLVFVGDSLTQYGQPLRAPALFDGRPWLISTATLTNLGAGSWINYVMVDGQAGTGAAGTLFTNAAGQVAWQLTGDTLGAYVDVSQGGWYYLNSGSPNKGILIAVRGGTAPVVSQSGAVVTSGNPTTWEYDLRGYLTWIAGGLADTFSDYQSYGIPSANTADILKFLPQVFQSEVEAVYLQAGVNDSPASGAAAATTIANLKAIVDYCTARARRVFVSEIFPNPSATAGVQRYLAVVSDAMRVYCRSKSGAVWVSAVNRMASFSATAATGKTGVYNADNLHLVPFGGYAVAQDAVPVIKQYYPSETARRSPLSLWDSTAGAGSLNTNPTLRGTGGVVTGGVGVTGTCPDGYSLNRSGTTQVVTTSVDAATDGGPDWWSMAVSGATAADFHTLNQTVTIPAGFAAGDYYRMVAEICVFGHASTGVAILTLTCADNNNNGLTLLQLQPNNAVATFTTEAPVLALASEPQKLIAGATSITMRFRVGAAAGGGTGKIGIRNFRLEKVSGPIAL